MCILYNILVNRKIKINFVLFFFFEGGGYYFVFQYINTVNPHFMWRLGSYQTRCLPVLYCNGFLPINNYYIHIIIISFFQHNFYFGRQLVHNNDQQCPLLAHRIQNFYNSNFCKNLQFSDFFLIFLTIDNEPGNFFCYINYTLINM